MALRKWEYINQEAPMKLRLAIMLVCLIAFVKTTWAEEMNNNGYFLGKLNPNEKLTYVMGYVEGIGELNTEIRHQMSILVLLYDKEKTQKYKYLAEYGKEMDDYYEKKYHYFNIPYRQFVEGLDKIYADFKNKPIILNDALLLVKQMLEGADEQEIEKRMVFMRKTNQEQERVINKELLEMKNK
jgi:hypothetical protein